MLFGEELQELQEVAVVEVWAWTLVSLELPPLLLADHEYSPR